MPENPEVFDAGQSVYSVSLPSFEGPLDLLLHLCQKHELNILDIPISFVTEKYLEYLAVMQLMNLDVASEYLLMAATLAHIKSKMLLPAPPPGQEDDALEEEEDPREALIRRLLEYQKYKQAAADLAARGVAGRDIFTRGAKMEEAVETGLPPLAEIPLYSLVEAFQRILSKSKVKLTHDIVADRISITDRIHELAEIIQARKRITFEALFEGLTTRFDLVITFLALLEMSKLRMTRLFQTEPLAPIYIELATDQPFEKIDADERPTIANAPAIDDVPEDARPTVVNAPIAGDDEESDEAPVESFADLGEPVADVVAETADLGEPVTDAPADAVADIEAPAPEAEAAHIEAPAEGAAEENSRTKVVGGEELAYDTEETSEPPAEPSPPDEEST